MYKMNSTADVAANRKRRAAILKKRREDGQLKPLLDSKRKQQRAEVAKLKAENLAIKKRAQKEKKEAAAAIKAGKKEINEQNKLKRELEKELRRNNTLERKAGIEKKKNELCKDISLVDLHQRMQKAVPEIREMKNFTSKDYSERKQVAISIWSDLRKHLSYCNKAQFESKRKKKIKKAPRAKQAHLVMKNRSADYLVPDWIVDEVDPAAYKRANQNFVRRSPRPKPSVPVTPRPNNKKKKRVAPTLVRPIA